MLDLKSALLEDANLTLLRYPSRLGPLEFVTFETWKLDGYFHVNFGKLDPVINVDVGQHFSLEDIIGLNDVEITSDNVALGYEQVGDIVIWRQAPDCIVFLERFRCREYIPNLVSSNSVAQGKSAAALARLTGELVATNRTM